MRRAQLRDRTPETSHVARGRGIGPRLLTNARMRLGASKQHIGAQPEDVCEPHESWNARKRASPLDPGIELHADARIVRNVLLRLARGGARGPCRLPDTLCERGVHTGLDEAGVWIHTIRLTEQERTGRLWIGALLIPVPLSKRLLLVDDEESVRRALRREFRFLAGFTLEDFESGLSALERHRAAPFEIAVLDLRMPVLDGVRLALALRETTPDLPIVFVTGEPDGELRRTARSMGCVIEKPWDRDSLLETVRGLVRNPESDDPP